MRNGCMCIKLRVVVSLNCICYPAKRCMLQIFRLKARDALLNLIKFHNIHHSILEL